MDIKNMFIASLATLTVFLTGYFVGTSKNQQETPRQAFVEKVMSGVEFQTQCFAMVAEMGDKQAAKIGALEAKLDTHASESVEKVSESVKHAEIIKLLNKLQRTCRKR